MIFLATSAQKAKTTVTCWNRDQIVTDRASAKPTTSSGNGLRREQAIEIDGETGICSRDSAFRGRLDGAGRAGILKLGVQQFCRVGIAHQIVSGGRCPPYKPLSFEQASFFSSSFSSSWQMQPN